jgi:PIN domain nuclease of toxin-antitoxin system
VGIAGLRLLLDTHAFLWWLGGDAALSVRAREAMADAANDVFVSAASAWEISTKYRIGKLPGVAVIVADLDATISEQGFHGLAISVRHGQIAGALPGAHRDPFDRMLIAQAMHETLALVSNEHVFDTFGVARLW